ncbi:hypothetical protein OIO90_000056 [Microbotryomycetes sp. JL221]|nr:hypothetical protein OIO90_000056 [Microbotryomycetes sp. JL221]
MLRRSLTLFGACLAAISTGTQYCASSYSPQLSERLGLNSKQTNALLLCANTAIYLTGPLAGALVDRKGHRLCMIIASVFLFTGYFVMRLYYDSGADGIRKSAGLVPLGIAQAMIGVGSSASYAGMSNSVARTFSSTRRATALSISIACIGLSAFLYSSLAPYSLMPGFDSTSSFLLLLAVGCSSSVLLSALLMRPPPLERIKNRGQTPKQPSASTKAKEDDGDDAASMPGSRSQSITILPEHDATIVAMEKSRSQQQGLYAWSIDSNYTYSPTGASQVDVRGWQLITSGDFGLLYLFLGLLTGCGLMFINNLGTVVHSFPYPMPSNSNSDAPLLLQQRLVSFLSICNCLGRLTVGPLSDLLAHKFARVWFLPPVAALFVAANAWASELYSLNLLWGVTALFGFAYGMLAAGLPPFVIDWFGLPSFTTNAGILGTAPVLFANGANLVFGVIYDAHATTSALDRTAAKQAGLHTPEHLCTLGNACFSDSFKVTSSLSAVAFVAAALLVWRRVKSKT